MEEEQVKLKKLKTIQECNSKVNEIDQNYSEKEPTNIVNITINNNLHHIQLNLQKEILNHL